MVPKAVLEDPGPAPFVCLPFLTHLIPLISSLVETARTKLGVSDKRDIQNVQGRGSSRTALGTTVLEKNVCLYFNVSGLIQCCMPFCFVNKKITIHYLFIYLVSYSV